ncbi:hypothetical protein UlMin_039437 [Ulmus minor]
MGACASSQTSSRPDIGPRSRSRSATVADQIKRLRTTTTTSGAGTTRVILADGRLQEFKQPIKARHVISQNPNCILCSCESMSVGTTAEQVPEEEELQPNQIYFVLPKSQANKPLSLPDLCGLAIKASSVIGKSAAGDLGLNNPYPKLSSFR